MNENVDLKNEPPTFGNVLLAPVNSTGKLKNECLFCGSRFCYERVVSLDLTYDEVSCMKHIKDLHKHSDIVAPKVMKQFISSTGIQKRGNPLLDLLVLTVHGFAKLPNTKLH